MENSFGSLISNSKSVLIILPTKPYFDQVASAMSLYLAINPIKETVVYSPKEMVVEFNRIIGVQKVTKELGNKNLNIRIHKFDAENIEKVSYDVFEGELNLTIVPKSGVLAPKKEQILLNYSGITADTVILVGGANESHFPILSAKEFEGAKIIHIGTRGLNLESDRIVLSFARAASTVSELTATLIMEAGLEVNSEIATNLLMGIEEGSNYFKGYEVTADTFQTVATLLRAGGQRMPDRPLRSSFPQGSIPGEEIVLEQKQVKSAPKDWLEPKIFKGTSVS